MGSKQVRVLIALVVVLGYLGYKLYDNRKIEKHSVDSRRQPKVGDVYVFKVDDADNKELPFRLMKLTAMKEGQYQLNEAKWGYPSLDALREGYGRQANDKGYFSAIPMSFEKKEALDEFLRQFEIVDVLR